MNRSLFLLAAALLLTATASADNALEDLRGLRTRLSKVPLYNGRHLQLMVFSPESEQRGGLLVATDPVMDIIRRTPQHTYQVLTKRASRMAEYFDSRLTPKNVWLGVTCESPRHYDRISHLRQIPATVRFLSCEPLLGDMADVWLGGIDWVITGGESGAKARRTPVEWFRHLRDQCRQSNVPFFFKQWGAWGEDGVKRSKYLNGSKLDGREWKEYPMYRKKASDKFSAFNEWEKTAYNKWIHMLVELQTPDKQYPGYMQTSSWQLKNLNSALASWSELKHNSILYAVQPMCAECGDGGDDLDQG